MAKNVGTLVTAAIRPNDSLDRIATAYSTEIRGGLHSVEDVTERDAIMFERRDWGMMCYVKDEDKTYQLEYNYSSDSILDNSNWVEFSGAGGGGGSSTEWVDSVNSIESGVPLTYATGDRFLGGTGPDTVLSGDWYGVTGGAIIERTSTSWNYIYPSEGWTVRVDEEKDTLYRYDGDYPTGSWKRERLNQIINSSATTSDGFSFSATTNANISEYMTDVIYLMSFEDSSLGTASININGLGEKPLVKGGPNGLRQIIKNDILPDIVYNVIYDGTNFQLVRNYSKDDLFSIKYYIEPDDFIVVPQYHQYWVYGDLRIAGELVNYGQVVVANGSLIVETGTFSNYGDLLLVNFNAGTTASYTDSDTVEFDVTNTPYTTVSASVKESSLTPNLLDTASYGGATAGYVLSSDGTSFKWVTPSEGGTGERVAMSITDYGTGVTVSNVQNIIFRGGVVSVPGGTAMGVGVTGESPTVTVWIPMASYVDNFNPSLYSSTTNRYVATPSTNGYTSSTIDGYYSVGDWNTETDFANGTTRPVTNTSSDITAFSATEFSCFDLNTTFDFYLFDGVGNTVSSIESYTISGNGSTQSGPLTITLSNFDTDNDRYKVDAVGKISLPTAFPNGGRFNYKIVHNNSSEGTYEFELNNDIFFDSPANQTSNPTANISGSVTFDESTNSLVYYSGVAFYKSGTVLSMTASGINLLNEITIPSTKQITMTPTNIPFSSTNDGYADGSKAAGDEISGWTLDWNSTGLTYSTTTNINVSSQYKPGFSTNNTISSVASSYVTANIYDYNLTDQQDSSAKAMLFDTVSATTPTYNNNPLNSELGRLSFDDVFTSGTASFDSNTPLSDTELQYIFGRVIYPQTDFTTFYPSDNFTASVDYSSMTASDNTFVYYTNTNTGATTSTTFSGYRWHVTSFGANSAYDVSFSNGVFTLNSNFEEYDLDYDAENSTAGNGDLVILVGIDSTSANETPDTFLYVSGDYNSIPGRVDALTYNFNKSEASKDIKFSKGSLGITVRKVWLFVGFKNSVRGKNLKLGSINFTV